MDLSLFEKKSSPKIKAKKAPPPRGPKKNLIPPRNPQTFYQHPKQNESPPKLTSQNPIIWVFWGYPTRLIHPPFWVFPQKTTQPPQINPPPFWGGCFSPHFFLASFFKKNKLTPHFPPQISFFFKGIS